MENNYDFKEEILYRVNKKKKDEKDKTKLKIFNEEFVKNNKSNFIIIYNDVERDLESYLEISKEVKNVSIILRQTNQITDISKMFSECKEFYSFPGFSKLQTDKVNNISDLFKNCTLSKIPDISNWNISNVINMSGIFTGCTILKSLPDLSKWNTSQVTDISSIFYGCSSLEKLPDISKWNTSNTKTMKKMFEGCSNLKELPDISKWDTKEVKNMNHMFYGCKSLSSLPDISKWNTKEVIDMSMMFYNCSGLNSLPDLNKWNVSNLKTKSYIFTGCNPNLNFPAFSELIDQNLENVNSNILPRSETINYINSQKMNVLMNFNQESLNKYYSKNYLCCQNCQGIPKIFLENNEDALLSCDFCGISEKVKISDIINITSKWIKRIFFKCSNHKQIIQLRPYADNYCKSCDIFLCQYCKKSHIKIQGKEHELEYIYNLDTIICEQHSSKAIGFCANCNLYVCKNCLINEHKSHEIKEEDEYNKLKLKTLNNFYELLEDGKKAKIQVVQKVEDHQNILSLLKLLKDDLQLIEDFKSLGNILYFSSKKLEAGKFKEDIINNYLDIFYYIYSLFKEEKIQNFNEQVHEKIDEFKIIQNNITKKDLDLLKKNIINTFAPIDPWLSETEKKKKFIENNIDFSRNLKKYIIIEKNKNPNNYIDKEEILYDVDKVLDGINSNSPEFILSVIGKCVENNGTELYITKDQNKDFKNLELASVQSLFSFATKKKYELHFNFGEEENEKILDSEEKQEEFLKKYKKLISAELKIKIDNLILRDIHRGSLGASCLILHPPEGLENSINNLEGKLNIEKVAERPLLDVLQISPNILDKRGNRFSHWGENEERGGEKYIPPTEGWKGYGLKVLGMYDYGNNDWLDYHNKSGEFAIAYMGINNFLGESKEMINDIKNYSTDVKAFVKNKMYGNDTNMRNSGFFKYFFDYRKCGDGVCLFQNPEYAENSSGIIYLPYYQVKVILMFRVNPKKIRQPENFKDCWILNPTPDEIRPYRILIKIIQASPLTDGFLTISTKPVEYILDLFKSKNESFYSHRKEDKYKDYDGKEGMCLDNEKFVIRIYTENKYKFYRDINHYLRDKAELEKNPEKLKMPLKHIESFIYCLQEALKNNKGVKDDTIVYRGIGKFKLPKDIGIGSKFYFNEFVSTSKKKALAKKFIKYEDKGGNTIHKGSLFIIKIKNNKKRNYCCDISDFSVYKNESEILISSFCSFIVTGIERNDEIDYVNLDCEGFLLDDLIKGNH